MDLLDRDVRLKARHLLHVKGVEDDYESNESDVSDDDEESEPAPHSDEKTIDPAVQDDIERFEESFRGIGRNYRLIDRIGEGTFSTVYKAEDLCYDQYENQWDTQGLGEKDSPWSPRRRRAEARYVAIKKIYVTSSPIRVQNELELLYDLANCECVCPLITAFRHNDQIVAILPYYQHDDFRDFFRQMVPYDIQIYFRELLTGLKWVHSKGIIHRDIKPTNFLFNRCTQRGVLVDFGLAEREGTEAGHCLCEYNDERRQRKLNDSYVGRHGLAKGYPKEDTRPSRRANRAGTRGFRAPEVLFKCPKQTTKIDIWSAGIILLTILSQRFPFFNSADDIDAMLELIAVFGHRRIKQAGYLHGAVLECNIPNISSNGYAFTKLIAWSTCKNISDITNEEIIVHKLLEGLLDLDYRKRLSAEDALEHPFFQTHFPEANDPDDDMVEMMGLRMLSASNAAKLDEELMSGGAFSIDQLMELAGLSVAQCVYRVAPPTSSQRVLIVCGPGNNGGDGLVAARHLHFFGYKPTVHYPKQSGKDIYKRLSVQLRNLGVPFTEDFPSALKETDHILDAIFGFSFSGDVRAPFDEIITKFEEATIPITAVDAPSSWNIERGPPEKGKVGYKYSPATLISLTAPKPLVQWYTGRHFVGGRFLTPSIAEKYGLDQPPYKGDEQVVEVAVEGQGEKL